MSDLILMLIVGLIIGLVLGVLLGLYLTTDSEGNVRVRSLPPSPHVSTATLPARTPTRLSGRLTVRGGSPQLIQRTEVYRLDSEDEADHVCRFCGLDLAQFDHTDCRRGIHGND
jgi:hypothetical protein